MLTRFYKWVKKFNPRYPLSLDKKIYNDKDKLNEYRFKALGENSFPTFNYIEIIKNAHILHSINPYELIEIAIDHHINEVKKSQFNVTEFLRGNKFRLQSSYLNSVLSGKEICQSPALLEKITQLDLYKIAYSTGFSEGRNFSKQLLSSLDHQQEKVKITKLKIVPKNLVSSES